MNYHNIKVPLGTSITVMGDIHEHDKQFFELIDKIQPSETNWFVSVGDIYDKGYGEEAAKKILDKIKSMVEQKIGFIILGNHEVKRINRLKRAHKLDDDVLWLAQLPLALSFSFSNGTRLTVVHAGVKPAHTFNDLIDNTELVYIRTLDKQGEYIPLEWVDDGGQKVLKPKKDGTVWHEMYDGRFGYIASGHAAQKDGIAKFYKFSCNLDTACYTTGKLTAQTFSEGKITTILESVGPAARGA